MSLILYNTLTRKKEIFQPQIPPHVSLYTCGPTVYDYAHIGNLRTYIFEDILRRVLEHHNFQVKHVMNITDVGHLTSDADEGEDKMEKGAQREKKTVWEIASYYTDAFFEDTETLNIKKPTILCKATDHITEQIALIQTLEQKGFTYKTADGIYFDTSKFPPYAQMARLDTKGLKEGARIAKNLQKHNFTDFALWKFSTTESKRAMEWSSPWGVGFPGWHIECSAMSMKYLDETIDIHCGGVDHIPIHHTNEIAQSEAVTGKQFVKFWLHGEFLLINEGRMGKSEGNFITIRSLVDKNFLPLAYRYFVLNAHYRSKLNFSWEALRGAQTAYTKLINIVSQWEPAQVGCAEFEKDFFRAIDDDLNTPQALAVLWELVRSDYPSTAKAATLKQMDKILGLSILEKAEELKEKIKEAGEKLAALLNQRQQARLKKDYLTSDKIRDQIREQGFIVEDTPDGQLIRPL